MQNALNATILKSAENGLSGIVIWGDHNDTNSSVACQQLKGYIHDALGPTVQLTSQAATNCSLRLCSGHGRCKGSILKCNRTKQQRVASAYSNIQDVAEPTEQNDDARPSLIRVFRQEVVKTEKDIFVPYDKHVDEECSCMCFSGWSGISCNMPSDDE